MRIFIAVGRQRNPRLKPGISLIIFLIWDINQHIFYIAIQYPANIIQCGGGNIAVVLQGMQRSFAEFEFFNQRIRSDISSAHGLPHWAIRNHKKHPLAISIIFCSIPLEYSRDTGHNLCGR